MHLFFSLFWSILTVDCDVFDFFLWGVLLCEIVLGLINAILHQDFASTVEYYFDYGILLTAVQIHQPNSFL